MNKVWFIFRGDHHLGPFSVREILRMYEEGKINGQTLLWAEGDSGWKALHLQERLVQTHQKPVVKIPPKPIPPPPPAAPIREIKEEDELPPELPPLPPVEVEPAPVALKDDFDQEISSYEETEIELHAPFTDLSGEDEIEDRDSLAPSLDALEAEGDLEVKSEYDESQEDEIDSFYEGKGINKRAPIKWAWPLRIVALIVILILSYQVLFTNVGPFKFAGLSLRRLPGLSRDIEQQLHRFSEENRGEFKVTLALGHKGQVIWLSSGLLGQGMMRLRLTSIEGELLGDDQIEAWSSAPYYGGAALFDNFKFNKGQGLIPGRYEAYLTYLPSGFWDGLFARLRDLTSRHQNPEQVLKFKYLYYLGANDQFDQSLAEFKAKKEEKVVKEKQEALAPIKMQIEYVSTLKELSERLIKLYESKLASMRRGQDINSFTLSYAKEIEPLYRPLTLESKAKMEDPEIDQKERSAWEEIHKDYRSLGDLVSDMQSMTSKRKTLSSTSKERLLRIFKARSSEITAKAEKSLADLMDQIDPDSKSL